MGFLTNMADGLRNAITGTGTARDPRSHNRHSARLLTQSDIAEAYSGSGLMRKIIAIPALDMVREWRDWKLEADEITAVENAEKRHAIRQKVKQAEVLRGLGGGALIMGLPGNASEPVPDTVGRDALAFVHVVSRWQLSFQNLQDDAREPGYGEPTMWQLNSRTGPQFIHPSRVIPFRADTASAMLTATTGSADAFWGECTVQQVLDAVQDSDSARASFAALIHKARLTRIGIPNLTQLVSEPGGEGKLSARLATLVLGESLHNAAIYDAGNGEANSGEKIDDVSYSFGGAKDVINAYGEFVAAISDIPVTRLLGRAPEGMNSSGESQQADWNKKIRAQQELDLAPCLHRLDRYLVPSALGRTPDANAWFTFNPLDMPSEADEATRFKTVSEALAKVQETGVIPEQAFNEAAQSTLVGNGWMPALESALAKLSDEERFGIAQGGGDLSGGVDDEPFRLAANDAAPRTLYVCRPVLNRTELQRWATAQGLGALQGDLHVTIASPQV